MKKLVSALLILAMMASIACISTSAAGIKLNMNFESMEIFAESFHAGNFYVAPEGGKLYGYNEARALQTKYDDKEFGYFVPAPYCWLTYDTSIDIIISDDDLDESDRSVAVVYANDNPYYYGRAEERIFMAFTYDIKDNCFRLCNYMENRETDGQFVAPVAITEEIDIEGNETHTMGMSVERGRIRCFWDGKLVIDYIDTEDDYAIAKEIVSPFLFWQRGNFVQISNITVADQGYLYPNASEDDGTTPPSDNPSENPGDIPEGPKDPANENKDPAEENKNPENPGENKDPADNSGNNADNKDNANSGNNSQNNPADTNNSKPAGGNSATTGDTAFVAVAVMVASLGCAVIVRKVSVR